jgi:hypothetical protein
MFRALLSPNFRSTTTVTTASCNRYTVLLSAAIVEDLEQHTQIRSSSSTIAADNNTVYWLPDAVVSYFVLLMMGDSNAQNM